MITAPRKDRPCRRTDEAEEAVEGGNDLAGDVVRRVDGGRRGASDGGKCLGTQKPDFDRKEGGSWGTLK